MVSEHFRRSNPAGTVADMKNGMMTKAKKLIMRMKIKNELARQCLGEIIGTFVLLVRFCAIFVLRFLKEMNHN